MIIHPVRCATDGRRRAGNVGNNVAGKKAPFTTEWGLFVLITACCNYVV
nr:MAG TPA: hypothetical protein [Caudoviricetes sp.]